MDDVPDYESYNEEQLQDALAHINRERFPAILAALQSEIKRRANELPIPDVTSSTQLSSPRCCAGALGGGFCGMVIGIVTGHIWFSILAARLKASGVNPYGHDDWGFGWMGCVFISVLICSFIGLFVGSARSRKK